MKIRAIITGVTGMVGEGVLHEAINHPEVEQVLIVSRKPSGVSHPKVKEVLHANFNDVSAIKDQLKGYNACFFCLGVSSVGMNEGDYTHLTYDLTLHFAKVLSEQNHDMVFNYVSGVGTDSREKGRLMWARVKGKTENDLMKLPFKKVYASRPGFIKPTPGLKNTLGPYKYTGWVFPILKLFGDKYACSLREIGLAMINAVMKGYNNQILEIRDIVKLAKA